MNSNNSKTTPLLKYMIILISIIGGLVLIGIVISIIKKNISSNNLQNDNQFGLPPLGYMDSTTLNCPDFWTLTDITDNSSNCIDRGGLNNMSSFEPKNSFGKQPYNTKKYLFPYNSVTDTSYNTTSPLKWLSTTDCSNTNTVNGFGDNYMCPYSHPYAVKFNNEQTTSGFICTNDGTSRFIVNSVEYDKFKKNYMKGKKSYINCMSIKNNTEKYKFFDGSLNDINKKISNVSCSIPGFICSNFSSNVSDISQNLCPSDYPYQDSKKCCKTSNLKDCSDNFFKVSGDPFKNNLTFNCPSNYPIAINDTNNKIGVFCSKKSNSDKTMLFTDAKLSNDIVGCNKTNLNLLNSDDDLYYACKSNNTCPEDYPYSINTGSKCCKINPSTDLDNNCDNTAFQTDCPDKNGNCNNYYTTQCTDKKSFPIISEKDWEKQYKKALKKKDMSLMRKLSGMEERCNWVNECGRVWQGIDPYC